MLTIGGVDYSEYLSLEKVNALKKKTTMNDINVEINTSVALNIKVGQELLYYIDGTLEFGGIVQTVYGDHYSGYATYFIYATAYEQITDRRTTALDVTNTTAGVIATMMVSILANDGITAGQIDPGATISYAKNAVSVRNVLDDIARASGFVWYINDAKELFFQADYRYVAGATLPSDFTLAKTEQTLKAYYNKIFVLGAKDDEGNQVLGQSTNMGEITRMEGLYGSGVYGTIIRSSDTVSDSDASILASKELLKRAYERDGITVESRSTRMVVGDIYSNVSIPQAFITNQDYVVDEVRIRSVGVQYVYSARLVAYDPSIVPYDERWQEKFRQFMNVNDESTAINSSVILTQRIEATENVTLDVVGVSETVATNTQVPTPLAPTENVSLAIVSVTETVTTSLV